MSEKLLEVKNLVKHFPVRSGIFSRVEAYVRAVDGISFDIEPGETLGLVGESGCGKSTAGRSILRLIEPTAGEILYKGSDIIKLDRETMRKLRREMQIIFQDPYASLNPRMTVSSIVGEPLAIHKIAKGKERENRVADILRRVGERPAPGTAPGH